jgi:hypothetical protein
LPNIQSDGSNGDNGLTPITLPEGDPDSALLIPITGASESFSISGIKSGTEGELSTFINKLKKWVADGGKLTKSNLTYVSTLDGTTLSVRATNWSKNWNAGDPNKLNYSLTLVRGTYF